MDTSLASATQAIQAILAPAVMISSSGLFFLGLNARQSSVLTRIRLLNDEKRKLIKEIYHSDEHEQCDDIRCFSIEHQMNVLLRRAWYVRNSIICHTLAVAFFVLTSFAIALHFLFSSVLMHHTTLYLFITGMTLVLCGIICLAIDEYLSYSVILIEVKQEDQKNFLGIGHHRT